MVKDSIASRLRIGQYYVVNSQKRTIDMSRSYATWALAVRYGWESKDASHRAAMSATNIIRHPLMFVEAKEKEYVRG